MFDIENYGSFIMAVIVFQMIPGAGTLTILHASAREGFTGGMKAVFGTLSGDFIYMLAAVLGLAAILAAYPDILAAAQWIGVIYLCWLGLKLLLSPQTNPDSHPDAGGHGWLYFRQAFAVCLTNPKAIMFFMAFFPLFLTSEPQPVTLVVMMAHVSILSLCYQTCLVAAGTAAVRLFRRSKHAGAAATRCAGAALIGFGVKLALTIK